MATPGQITKEDVPKLGFTRLIPPVIKSEATDIPSSSPSSPPPAIVFLHGAESCSLEYSRVTPLLEDTYDIFLVDLPAHSRSKHVLFSFDNTMRGIIRILNTHQVKAAHIVGLSLGGFLALEFARQYHDRVLSVWCTGCAPFTGFRMWFMQHPRLLSGVVTLAGKAGKLTTEKLFYSTLGASNLQPIPGLREEVQKNQNMATLTPVYEELAHITNDNLTAIQASVRVMIVAGGRLDSVADTKTAGEALQRTNPASCAYVVRDAIHWWSLQFPELFARGIRAWIEGTEMPKEYEPLK
ncbi:hypothetical protein SBRCBS47491_004476 [Sporothrix bragantina]|uniref:AB hydrolase-1 domain-containing protein n=1 Tax=Sporothrix bragantina TaxID=671064 RepID=A0ABP0BQ95_9PEZI